MIFTYLPRTEYKNHLRGDYYKKMKGVYLFAAKKIILFILRVL